MSVVPSPVAWVSRATEERTTRPSARGQAHAVGRLLRAQLDVSGAAQGVVVGTAGWPERLEANKQAGAVAVRIPDGADAGPGAAQYSD